MARKRRTSVSGDVLKLGLLLVFLLVFTGMLPPVLTALGVMIGVGLIFAALYVVFVILTKKKQPEFSGTPDSVPLRNPPPIPKETLPEIEVECPNCKNELVAPGEMAGEKARCEVCQAVFPLPRPRLKLGLQMTDTSFLHLRSRPAETPRRFTLDLLKQLEWKRFEKLVEAYFEKTGWRTQLNRTGPDGGVDVNLFKPDQEGVAAVVQCKAWNTYKVGIKPVRELLGVMAAGKIPEGYFVTTDIFTYEAIDFAKEQPLTLLDGYEFLRRIHALQKDEQTALLDLATAGDYKTPTCPSCGRKMVKRVSGKGRNIGDSFWGCPSFPRCRARLNMKRA